jgi:plastocyanin
MRRRLPHPSDGHYETKGVTGMASTRLVFALVSLLLLVACGGGAAGDGEALSVTGTDGLQFEPSQLTAQPGQIQVELTAEEAVNHTFVVEEADGDVEVASAPADGTDMGTVQLESGEYTFYCSVPGHREAGMEGTLTVQ